MQPSVHNLRNKARGIAAGHTHDELDRLGGKTHLIASDTNPYTEQSPVADKPSQANEAIQYAEDMHPRILRDLQMFDDFDFSSFGLDPTVPQSTVRSNLFDFSTPMSFESGQEAMPDLQFNSGSNNDFYSGQTAGTHVYPELFPPGPPVVDTTWQSFVEQLGF